MSKRYLVPVLSICVAALSVVVLLGFGRVDSAPAEPQDEAIQQETRPVIELLTEIRDELRSINRKLTSHDVPSVLADILSNVAVIEGHSHNLPHILSKLNQIEGHTSHLGNIDNSTRATAGHTSRIH